MRHVCKRKCSVNGNHCFGLFPFRWRFGHIMSWRWLLLQNMLSSDEGTSPNRYDVLFQSLTYQFYTSLSLSLHMQHMKYVILCGIDYCGDIYLKQQQTPLPSSWPCRREERPSSSWASRTPTRRPTEPPSSTPTRLPSRGERPRFPPASPW